MPVAPAHLPDGKLVSERLSCGPVYYYGYDALGSTVALVDTGGLKQQSYSYEPYGAVTPLTGGIANPWRYARSYMDPTGYYKMGARYYAAGLMRWTQQDPKEAPTDVHRIDRYAYVGGDPINQKDPNGLDFTISGTLHAVVGGSFSLGVDDEGFPIHGSVGLGGGADVGLSASTEESGGGLSTGLNAHYCAFVYCGSGTVGFSDTPGGISTGGSSGWGLGLGAGVDYQAGF